MGFAYKAKGMITGGAATVAVLLGMLEYHEGSKLETYYDSVGIATVCMGHTSKELKIGQVFTKEQCSAIDIREAMNDLRVLDKYVKVPLPEPTRIAVASFIHNVGEGNFKHSTMLKKFNSSDYVGACNEFSKWTYAKGKYLVGLANRRADERELCLIGLESVGLSF